MLSARLIDDGVGRREEGRRRRRRANSQQRSTQGPKDGRRRHCPTPDEDSPTKRGIKCLVFLHFFIIKHVQSFLSHFDAQLFYWPRWSGKVATVLKRRESTRCNDCLPLQILGISKFRCQPAWGRGGYGMAEGGKLWHFDSKVEREVTHFGGGKVDGGW